MKFKKLISAGALILILGATGCSTRAMNDYGYNENGKRMQNSINELKNDYYNDYSYNNNYRNYTNDTKVLGRKYPKTHYNNSGNPLKTNIRETVRDNKIVDVNKDRVITNDTATKVRNRNTTRYNNNTSAKLKNNINNTRLNNNVHNNNTLVNKTRNVYPYTTKNNITKSMNTEYINDTTDYLTNNDYNLRNADFNYYTDANGTKTVVEKNYRANKMPLTRNTHSVLTHIITSKVGFKGVGFKGIYNR